MSVKINDFNAVEQEKEGEYDIFNIRKDYTRELYRERQIGRAHV